MGLGYLGARGHLGGRRGGRAGRIAGALVAAAAVVSLAAGCGGGSDSDHRAADAVLTQDELPAGFTVAKLGKDELQQVTDQFHDSTKGVEVVPAHCAASGSVPTSIDTATTGVMAATDSAYSISESVQPVAALDGGVDLEQSRRRVTGDCASVTVTVEKGPIKGATITVDHKVVPLPKGRADSQLVVESVSTTVNGAKKGSQRLLVGRAVVNDLLVTVQMSPLAQNSTEIDREVFVAVLTKAVAKAAA